MSDEHEWCRDVQRDEAVRAAEDAAAVPEIQHRDLPEQVALLWASLGDIIGRVVRLEGEMDAGQDEEAAPAEGMRKERGESVRVVDEADAASDEAVAHGATLSALAEARESLAAANRGIARLTAERDAAKEEFERLREEKAAGWKAACESALAASKLVGTLKACVAELESAAANAGGEQQPPRGWLTAEDRDWIAGLTDDDDFTEEGRNIAKALLARSTPPRVKGPTGWAYDAHDMAWIAAIRTAGGEVEG